MSGSGMPANGAQGGTCGRSYEASTGAFGQTVVCPNQPGPNSRLKQQLPILSPRRRPSSNERPPRRRSLCARRDLNPHTSRYWNLNPARLPIPPLARRMPLSARGFGNEGLPPGRARCGPRRRVLAQLVAALPPQLSRTEPSLSSRTAWRWQILRRARAALATPAESRSNTNPA